MLAVVTSRGTHPQLQALSTTAVATPVIDLHAFHYYVEVSFGQILGLPTCGNLELVGVQIEFTTKSKKAWEG